MIKMEIVHKSSNEGYPPPPWVYDIAGAAVWLMFAYLAGLMVASFVLEALR